MEPETREALLARFAAYLDGVPDREAGEDAEAAPDLFTLLAELAALRNEVRLESRQFKGALDQFREVFELVESAQARLEDDQARRGESERRARQDAERDLLLELLDLRDRLQAGEEQARRYDPGWLARRGGAPGFVAGMADGLGMSLRRLDEILARRGVRPLAVVGVRFDPQTMHAADLGRDPSKPDGAVLAERRKGFAQDERLLRAAEVTVNRLVGTEGD